MELKKYHTLAHLQCIENSTEWKIVGNYSVSRFKVILLKVCILTSPIKENHLERCRAKIRTSKKICSEKGMSFSTLGNKAISHTVQYCLKEKASLLIIVMKFKIVVAESHD